MGDYLTEVRIGRELEALDTAMARRDRIAANYHLSEVNRLRTSLKPGPAAPSIVDRLPVPAWTRQVIRNRGLRLPALESALGVDSVVLTGSFGSKNELRLEFKF